MLALMLAPMLARYYPDIYFYAKSNLNASQP